MKRYYESIRKASYEFTAKNHYAPSIIYMNEDVYYCLFHDCWFLDCHGPDGPRNDVMNGRFDVMITTVCSPTRCGFPCRHRSLSPESRSPESIWLPAGLHCSSDIPPQGK